jgi:hypothetical protein
MRLIYRLIFLLSTVTEVLYNWEDAADLSVRGVSGIFLLFLEDRAPLTIALEML